MERSMIIKALECCDGTLAGCEECPNYNNRYRCKIKQDALSLIKELTVELDAMRGAANSYKMHYEKAKADTVREMQERLKAVAYQSSDWSHGEHPMVVEVDDIDEVVNEILNKNTEECTECKHFVGCEPSTLGGCDLYEEEEKK